MNQTPAQKLLTEAYNDYVRKSGKRRVSDNKFARYLDVSPASFNQWINGNREPNLENAIKLSKKLGVRVFDILGYPTVIDTDDEGLKFVIQNWWNISESDRVRVRNMVHSMSVRS